MKNKIVLFLFFIVSISVSAQELSVIDDLIARIMPMHRDQFRFTLNSKAEQHYYKISTSGKKVHIEGNSPVSIASGIDRYMKEFLNTCIVWTDFTPVLPEKLPLPEKKIEEHSPYSFITYMNYCTFGYSTTYWNWERWEKEIDQMALHGVTHPLAMVGIENVWYNFLLKIGYSSDEAKKFLTGPSYIPWLLMGNMETLGGPMPEEWFIRQAELQQKILKRMRSYGMKPIFQAFYGMVPTDFKTKFPNTNIVVQGDWCGFNRPDILSPLDPEFKRLAKIWYDEYDNMFGTADYYAGDLFHEGGKTGNLDITACAKSLQSAMLQHNPQSVWVIQGWGNNPTKALLAGLSPKHSLIIELCAEYWSRWEKDGGYNGIPWVWSNISNWGGNIGSHGRLDAIASRSVNAQKDKIAGKTLTGLGYTPEGIGVNPVVFALYGDMVWTKKSPDMVTWINNYAKYRYNTESSVIQEAWQGFYKTIYGTFKDSRQPSESVFCAKPSLKVNSVSSWGSSKIHYNPDEFAITCAIFLKDAEILKRNKNYAYDAVDVVRQYISNLGRKTYAEIQEAWKNKDRQAFDFATNFFLQLIKDQDELLLTHSDFCLNSWLKMARDAGKTESAKNQYEFYNRMLISSWNSTNGVLNDYAHREYGGLLGTYYLKRWEIYFNYLDKMWYNPNIPEPDLFGITRTWLYQNIENEIQLSGKGPVETAVKIFNKYYQK